MTRRLLAGIGLALALAAGTGAAQQAPPTFQLAWVDRQGTRTPIGALPPGTTLAADGTLAGTPTAGGPFSVTGAATASSTGPGPASGWLVLG